MSKMFLPLWIVLVFALMAASAAIAWLRSRTASARVATKLYGSIVAQARQPGLYERLGATDTLAGRFEMVALHVALVLERLRPEGALGARIGRSLLEAFVADMDAAVREMGIGDAGVPRRVHKAAAALQERCDAYRTALAGPDPAALEAALAGHALAGAPAAAAAGLARYTRQMQARLAGTRGPALLAGDLDWAPGDADRPPVATASLGQG